MLPVTRGSIVTLFYEKSLFCPKGHQSLRGIKAGLSIPAKFPNKKVNILDLPESELRCYVNKNSDNGTRSHSAGGHHRPPQHASHLSPHRQKVHPTQRCPGVRLCCGSQSDDCSTQSSPPCHHQESQYLSWKTQQEQEWSISTLRDRARPRTRKIDSIRCRDSCCPAVRG